MDKQIPGEDGKVGEYGEKMFQLGAAWRMTTSKVPE